MRSKDQMALLGLLPGLQSSTHMEVWNRENMAMKSTHSPVMEPWAPMEHCLNTHLSPPSSNHLFSSVVVGQKHTPPNPNSWMFPGLATCESPGSGSSTGSFALSPILQTSPGSSSSGSSVFERYPQHASKARSMVNAGAFSPTRPKNFDIKTALSNTRKASIPTQQQMQDAQNEDGAGRPKSESEKEKVWKQKPERYKTELCRAFEDHNWCKYGSRCQFAHGLAELRQVERHPKYKTQLCNAYQSAGYCKYGSRCHFVHNVDESRVNSSSSLMSNANSALSRQCSREQASNPKVSSNVEPNVEMPQIPDGCMEAKGRENREVTEPGIPPVTPIGTPVKSSDLSPYDITKEHFMGSDFLNKQFLASIWMPENNDMSINNNNAGFAPNSNVVFNFLPKNLLEM